MKFSFPVALIATILIAGGIGWAISQASTPPHRVKRAAVPHHPARHRPTRPVPHLPRGWSYTALARGHRLVIFRRPFSRRVQVVLHNPTDTGGKLTLLVKRARGRWLQVFLPMRPNGIKGWVPLGAVRLFTTAFALRVDLTAHRLFLIAANRVKRTFKIGVGRSVSPTPSGRYFITELLKQPDPGGVYGPYAFGLSAYSGVYQHFGRGGNGQIGIHGTDEPWAIGSDVSHGCIRLANRDITWLARRLPLGVPVTILRRRA